MVDPDEWRDYRFSIINSSSSITSIYSQPISSTYNSTAESTTSCSMYLIVSSLIISKLCATTTITSPISITNIRNCIGHVVIVSGGAKLGAEIFSKVGIIIEKVIGPLPGSSSQYSS
jgi:hypothetical protein